MLVDANGQSIVDLLDTVQCRVELPEEWSETFFHESGPIQTSYDERRRFVRHRFRSRALLDTRASLPHIERHENRYVVYTCDVARSGFGFVHEAQLFPGELAKLWLPAQSFDIRISRCRKLQNNCYLIGAQPITRTGAEGDESFHARD